jgi:predicted dehydrogenase
VGTQARVSPEIEYLKQLIAEGFVGEMLSTTVIARGGGWGGFIAQQKTDAYTLDRTAGATMLTIPVGHLLAALTDVLGEIVQLTSVLATRRTTALAMDTRETLPVSAPDQVLVSGILDGGAPVSIHYRGGMARDGKGFLWEVNGTKGDIRVLGPFGHPQLVPLSLEGARGEEKAFHPLEVPETYRTGWPEGPIPGNVARLYGRLARDLSEHTRTAPTFDDAVAVHRIMDSIERAAEQFTEPIEKGKD